jgi:hypothetical protein
MYLTMTNFLDIIRCPNFIRNYISDTGRSSLGIPKWTEFMNTQSCARLPFQRNLEPLWRSFRRLRKAEIVCEPTKNFPTGCVYKKYLSISPGPPPPPQHGGGFEYLHRSPESRRRQRKWITVPGGHKYGPSSWRYLESETVKLGLASVNDYAGADQQQLYTTDPSSRQRGRPAWTKPQLTD